MQQVRMQHCSQLYVTTFMMHNDLVLKCFSVRDLAVASLCASESAALKDAKHQLLQDYPSWAAPARPNSKKEPSVDWSLPLSELQEAMAKHLESRAESNEGLISIDSRSQVLQGQQLSLKLRVRTMASDTYLGIYLHVGKGVDRIVRVVYRLHVLGVNTSQSVVRPESRYISQGFADGGMWGYKQVVEIGQVTSWSETESVLRGKGLVHADGCLHLEAEIRGVW
eukprot:GHUV01005366.1.p1 GENE.GHUV01005366.1~~GHUV01005366.1.p1  ORF type:complete len:224 (+),score=44.12 GHUV01005366.1:924-1595(+)